MEPPPPSLSSTAVASTVVPSTTPSIPPPPSHAPTSYPESIESSPRSRTTENWDDLPAPSGGGTAVSSKLRLMCSYGGHILPRPHVKSLCYIGGDTRIVVVDRSSSLSSLVARLSNTLLNGRSFTLKYQLPSEDLDSLISVTTDEDLDNMIEEYDRTISNSAKPSRLRLFLFTPKPEATQSMGQILENSAKSDDWFLDALNSGGLNRGFSESDTNVNRLLGLDDALARRSDSGDNGNNHNLDSSVLDDDGSVKSAKQQQNQQQQQQIQQPPPQKQGGQDVHNLPDSPMMDTSSSFGSTSSSPSLANLPPIRVHVEEPGSGRAVQDQRLGIEEQFARINVENNKHLQHQQEDGFAAISSPPPPMPATISLPAAPVNATAVSSEFQTRVYSDDERSERSDHGAPAAYRKPPTPRSQPPQNLPPQQAHHLKSNSSGQELPSPHSSDSSMSNPVFHQRPSVYQEPIAQIPSGSTVVTGLINPSDPNTLLSQNQSQNQNQDQSYIMHNPQFEQQPHPQQQQQQQQFIHATPQYIHHHPPNGHPVQTYIQVYPTQQQSFHRHPSQLDQQQPYPPPVYYVSTNVPPRPYLVPVPQSGSVNEAPGSLSSNNLPQAQTNSSMMAPPPPRSGPSSKPEAGVYTTPQGMGGAAQMVHQIPTGQQQFMGYSPMHHYPPQSFIAGNPNYGYENTDNGHKQMYYNTQPVGHTQYQTMTGMPPPAAMVLPDGSAAAAKLPAESVSQQIRSSQPL